MDELRVVVSNIWEMIGLQGNVLAEVTHWSLLALSLLFALLCGTLASRIVLPVVH